MPAVAYCRRTPETEPLCQAMAGHLETFLEGLRASDRQLPAEQFFTGANRAFTQPVTNGRSRRPCSAHIPYHDRLAS